MPDISSVNTELDMSQPDGLPKERERNPDGTYKSQPGGTAEPRADAKRSGTDAGSHPPGLVALAKDFGFSDEEIADFSVNALSTAIRRTRAVAEAQRAQFAQADVGTRQAPVPEPELDLGLNTEEYDEKVVGAFNKLKSRDAENTKAIKELREELAQTRKANEDRDNQQTAQFVDDAFESLGADYEAYFGKGSGYDLRNSDPDAFQRRLLLLNASGVDPKRVSGKSLMSALKASADKLFKITPKKPDENPYEAKPKTGGPSQAEWDRGGTAMPTQRNNANEPNGVEKAKKNLRAKFREEGLNTSSEDRDIIATLPKR